MTVKEMMKFTKTHEWIFEEEGKSKVGISDHAQDQLGDIVFLSLPEVGDQVTKGKSFTEIESVKAVSEVYSPLTGVVTAINEVLVEQPEIINQAPYETWLIEVSEVTDTDELMSYEAYKKYCEEV